MLRWVFHDTVTSEEWVFTYNPNNMTSPHLERATVTSQRSPIDASIRGIRRMAQPREWGFGGFIRSQAHYEELAEWVDRGNPVELTDHLNRTFLIRLIQFIPNERTPNLKVSWRFTYQMSAVVLRRIS